MTNYLFYVTVIILVTTVIYFASNKISNSIASEAAQNLEAEYAKHKHNPTQLLQNILYEPDWFYVLTNYLQLEKIEGIVQCLKITAVEDWVKNSLLKETDKSLSRLTGVRFHQDNPASYYIVLTENNLHYIGYREGKCLEHSCFPLGLLANLQLENISYKEMVINDGRVSAATSKKLSFSSEGVPYNIIMYNFIIDSPYQYLVTGGDTRLWLYALTKGFHAKLGGMNKAEQYTGNRELIK